MIFPSTATLHNWKTKHPRSTLDEQSMPSVTVDIIYSHKNNFDEKFNSSPHVQACTISESRHRVPFVKKFKRVGATIECILDNTIDVKKNYPSYKISWCSIKLVEIFSRTT